MKMFKAFLICSLLSPVLGWAGDEGTTGAGFLKLGVGARAVGMGEAYSAVADDATALYWNPAALRQVEKNSVTFMHASYLESSNFQYGAFAHSAERTSVGIGVQHMSAGTLTGRDQNGVETGGFDPRDLAVALGYARDIGAISVGFSAKYIQSKIIDSAQTGAVDVGLLSPSLLDKKLRFALTASNLGGKIKFDQKSESLPVLFKLGSVLHISKVWLLSADIGLPKDNSLYGAIGTEYVVPIGREMFMAGRAGYNSRSAGDIDGFSGPSFGAGFKFDKMNIDYGFVPFGDVGSAHRVSLGWSF